MPWCLSPVQPCGLEADLKAALEHIALHIVPRRLYEGQRRSAHLHHIAHDIALHLMTEPTELLWRGGSFQPVPQLIYLGVLVVDLIRPHLAVQEIRTGIGIEGGQGEIDE